MIYNESIYTNLKFKILSDTLIVYSNSIDNYALLAIVYVLENFRIGLIENDFLVRGAIVKGNHFLREDVMVSEAFIKAYELEENIAIYPRLLIEDDLVHLLKSNHTKVNESYYFLYKNKKIEFVKDIIKRDYDNRWIITPFINISIIGFYTYEKFILDNTVNQDRESEDNRAEYRSVISKIKMGIENCRKKVTGEKEISKIEYFIRKYNSIITNCKLYGEERKQYKITV